MTSTSAICRAPFLLICLASGLSFANDLAPLSDEFDDGSSQSDWSRVHVVEGWNADDLEVFDIDATTAGRMTMVPFTTSWFEDYRGPLVFKEVTGDFVITTDVEVSARDGVSVPGIGTEYSLAGIMIRTPRDITPQTWTQDGENYIFLSLGYGNAQPPNYQFEVKTTIDGESTLILSSAPANQAAIQVARVGDAVIVLRREPGQPWVVHNRYERTDFPETMQVGLVSYTDWRKVSQFDPFVQNSNTLQAPLPGGVVDPDPGTPFAPDLIAAFDYARFARPQVPVDLEGLDLTNPGTVSDADLLSFLGENANLTGTQAVPAASTWGLLVMLLSVVLLGTQFLRAKGVVDANVR
ncbi:MAG: hypothetical protein ACPGXK_04345 [Phycisphaerae bacterium]